MMRTIADLHNHRLKTKLSFECFKVLYLIPFHSRTLLQEPNVTEGKIEFSFPSIKCLVQNH